MYKTFTVYITDFFHFYRIEKACKKMFKVNNGTVQNKCTMEKFDPNKDRTYGNLVEKISYMYDYPVPESVH